MGDGPADAVVLRTCRGVSFASISSYLCTSEINAVRTMKKPFIFITNDDGVNARGLKAVTEVALRFGRVVVIAPETTQSGMGHAVTMYQPLYLRTVEQRDDL